MAHAACDVEPAICRARGIYVGRVCRNHRICTDHYRLTLRLDGFPPSVPGQFVQLDCRPGDGASDGGMAAAREVELSPGVLGGLHDADVARPLAYLRRPFSIAGRRDLPDGGVELDIIHRVVGKGTGYLAELADGMRVSVLGPLGRGFALPEDMALGLMVGGGVGIPPMFYLAEALAAARKQAVGFVGAQRKDLVPLTIAPCMPAPAADGTPQLNAAEFAEHGYATVVTTDDGSMGMKGFVTEALRGFVEKYGDEGDDPATRRRGDGATSGAAAGPDGAVAESPSRRVAESGPRARSGIVVFCCGPTPMMRATVRVCAELGVRCQVSLEQPMACGMGTCQSCVIRWRPAGAADEAWVYKLTCTDGPVFDAREIVWQLVN